MIRLHTEVWPVLRKIKTKVRPRKVDILTGYLGAGASDVLKTWGVKEARIVVGLDTKSPCLPTSQLRELRCLQKSFQLKISSGLHAKLYLFDNKLLAMGSANFTKAGFSELQELIIVTDDPTLIKNAGRVFDTIWSSAKEPPATIKQLGNELSSSTSHEVARLGKAFPSSQSPFGIQRVTRKHSGSHSRSGADDQSIIRLCAYYPKHLTALNQNDTLPWSTSHRAVRGAVQVFCISNPKGAKSLMHDPQVDSVHSIWQCTSKKAKPVGRGRWPGPHAKFKLLVRLEQPVARKQLIDAGLLKNWPQNPNGKLYRRADEIRKLDKLLSAGNPTQTKLIFRAFGITD